MTAVKPVQLDECASTYPIPQYTPNPQSRDPSYNSGQSSLAQKSFFGCAHTVYNSIPVEIRTARSLPLFKKKLKGWIRAHIPIA